MTPASIPAIHRILKQYFEQTQSPVAHFMEVRTLDPFRVLVATILSARTKDQTTTLATERLFKEVQTLDALGKLPLKTLETLIFPVGFYRTKARMLAKLPAAVQTLYGGIIPETVEELIKLPGVGRKTANLVVTEAFDKHGICVDIHVHRISNRLGLLKTSTPEQSEIMLRKLLPKRYWKTWNRYLVAFGQTLCLPRTPRCNVCPIARYCKRVGVHAPVLIVR
jgi:endonuclease III